MVKKRLKKKKNGGKNSRILPFGIKRSCPEFVWILGTSDKAIKREYYQLPTFQKIASRLSGSKMFTKLYTSKG